MFIVFAKYIIIVYIAVGQNSIHNHAYQYNVHHRQMKIMNKNTILSEYL